MIFVGSVGAVVRLIAPLISSKDNDPAVLAIDSKGVYLVPLLGGHKAGAEKISFDLAADIGGTPILTGDSNTEGRLAIDCFGESWGWIRSGDSNDWKELMIRQVKKGECNVIQLGGSVLWRKLETSRNYLFNKKTKSEKGNLFIGSKNGYKCSWHPATLWIGIGCERNTSEKLIQRAIKDSLFQNGLSKFSVAGIASIDRKSDEKGLLQTAKANEWPIKFYSSIQLRKVSVLSPSEVVEKEMGTPSVAEASSILSSGVEAKLISPKKIYHSNTDEVGAVTVAISESIKPFAPGRGELHLIGSGPGELAMISHDSRSALSRSVVWIGYKLYLELLEPIRRIDQVRIDSELTCEIERCKYALELAKQGVRVALISSGDSGIYGMAGLALELWLKEMPQSRPLFQVHPGISAFQVAAAKLGAPLMHDFCCISLSDLMTPWEVIEERIKCAAKGDFVVAIYNPKSNRRTWQLKKFIEIFLKFRLPKTPVALARQLGRSQEEIEIFDLESIPLDQVDMLSLLIVGNSQSFAKDNFFVTPRGYLSPGKSRNKQSG